MQYMHMLCVHIRVGVHGISLSCNFLYRFHTGDGSIAYSRCSRLLLDMSREYIIANVIGWLRNNLPR